MLLRVGAHDALQCLSEESCRFVRNELDYLDMHLFAHPMSVLRDDAAGEGVLPILAPGDRNGGGSGSDSGRRQGSAAVDIRHQGGKITTRVPT